MLLALDSPINDQKRDEFIEGFLFPPDTRNTETLVLAGLTVGDLLFGLLAINSRVLEAADFSHTADISDPFKFVDFASEIVGLSTVAMQGHEVNLLGYTAERIVAARLTDAGYLVSIPESASEPGYDLIVDDVEFQVKCLEPESYGSLEKHFENHPGIPVFANSELIEIITDKSPEWVNQVFFIEVYTHEFTNRLVNESVEAGAKFGDYELILFIATMSVIKNPYGLWVGNQSLKDALFNVALESAAKGVLAH